MTEISRTRGEIAAEIRQLEERARELGRQGRHADAASCKIRAFALRWALGVSPHASVIHLRGASREAFAR
jgi:hypothetical protein